MIRTIKYTEIADYAEYVTSLFAAGFWFICGLILDTSTGARSESRGCLFKGAPSQESVSLN